jgi:hypothetical protein
MPWIVVSTNSTQAENKQSGPCGVHGQSPPQRSMCDLSHDGWKNKKAAEAYIQRMSIYLTLAFDWRIKPTLDGSSVYVASKLCVAGFSGFALLKVLQWR